jgi:hypothetical protein
VGRLQVKLRPRRKIVHSRVGAAAQIGSGLRTPAPAVRSAHGDRETRDPLAGCKDVIDEGDAPADRYSVAPLPSSATRVGFVSRPMASFSEGLKQIIPWWKACGCAEAPDRQIQNQADRNRAWSSRNAAIRSIVPEPLICVRSGKGKGRRSAGPRSSYLNLAMLSLVTRAAPESISDSTFSPRIAFTRASTPVPST